MTARCRALIVLALGALLSGLTLGGRIFYLSAVFAVLAIAFSALSVLAAKRRMRFDCRLSCYRTPRGESVELTVALPGRALLPISPVEITLRAGEYTHTVVCTLRKDPGSFTLTIPAAHVGEIACTVESAIFTDVLGLFRAHCPRVCAPAPLLVLPRSFEIAPLRFLSGDDGRSLPNRSSEDLSSPEDVRAYRDGDALKRVHWKLSARKRELIVRKFETSAPPDTLILLDCSAPGNDGTSPESAASLRDALCETALSVAAMQSKTDAPVRLPFYGREKGEFHSDRSGSMDALKEMLALEDFSGADDFSRILNLELRRMRRTGATVIITSRLSAATVEGVKHIRRMGPSARVYLITHTPDAPEDRSFVAQLQQSLVEVCYVTPA